jgi:hypothetical protein
MEDKEMKEEALRILYYFVGVFSGAFAFWVLTRKKKHDTVLIGKIRNWVE